MLNEHDQMKFMQLWTAAQPAVASYVHALVRNRAVADDVLQEISLLLFRRFEEYDEATGPFVAWGLGIARFQVLSWQRDQARSRVAFDEELLARFTSLGLNCRRGWPIAISRCRTEFGRTASVRSVFCSLMSFCLLVPALSQFERGLFRV